MTVDTYMKNKRETSLVFGGIIFANGSLARLNK